MHIFQLIGHRRVQKSDQVSIKIRRLSLRQLRNNCPIIRHAATTRGTPSTHVTFIMGLCFSAPAPVYRAPPGAMHRNLPAPGTYNRYYDQAKAAFIAGDLDRNGVLDAQELFQVLTRLGFFNGVPPSQISQIMEQELAKADRHQRDRLITFEEFVPYFEYLMQELQRRGGMVMPPAQPTQYYGQPGYGQPTSVIIQPQGGYSGGQQHHGGGYHGGGHQQKGGRPGGGGMSTGAAVATGAAVGVGGVLAYQNAGAIGDFAGDAAGAVGGGIVDGANAVAGWAPGAASAAGDGIVGGANAVADWAPGAAGAVGDFAGDAGGAMMNAGGAVADWAPGAMDSVGDFAGDAFSAIADFF